jgi:hypothetical protein
MGLVLSEPVEKVVEIPKILMKMSVEDAKTSQNAKNRVFRVFSPRAVPGIQIDENRENKEKTGRGRKQRIKNEYRAAPRRFRVP